MIRLAFWQMRGEWRKVWIVVFCVALGVSAHVAVGSFLSGIRRAFLREARGLLSADLEILSKEPFDAKTRRELADLLPQGSRTQETMSFLTMAASGRRSRLSEVRAVEPQYPFYGELSLLGRGKTLKSVAEKNTVFAQRELLAQVGAQAGGKLKIGRKEFTIGGTIDKEPGLGANIFSLGPRVLMPFSEAAGTGLADFGSRVYYGLYVLLPRPEESEEVARKLKAFWKIPERPRRFSESLGPESGLTVRTALDKQNHIRQFFERLAEYLQMVSLMALLLGGIGVASVIRSYVVEHLKAAATLRTLGSTPGEVAQIFYLQAGSVGLAGSLLGAALGALFQNFLPLLLGRFIPFAFQARADWASMASGVGLGILVSSFFGLLPILSVRTLKPLEVFRGEISLKSLSGIPWPFVLTGSALLVAVSVLQARSRVQGLFFAGSFLGSAGLLYLLGRILLPAMARARRLVSGFAVRHGLSNLARPHLHPYGPLTALGLSSFLLGALIVYQVSLVKELDPGTRPEKVPVFFLLDVQDDQADAVRELIKPADASSLVLSPMINARYRGKNGETRGEIRGGSLEVERDRYFRDREQNLSFREAPGENEEIIAGKWMDPKFGDTIPNSGELGIVSPNYEASLEDWFAERLNVKLGDLLRFDVQGVPVEARLTSIRKVNWASFLPTFFIYLTPEALREAPKTWVGSILGVPAEKKEELQNRIIGAFPNVTVIDVAQVAEKIVGIMNKISWAIYFVAIFSLAAGLIVLSAMALAQLRQRQTEGVLLKVLGAGRGTIFASVASEFAALSGVSAGLGLALSSAFSWALLTYFLEIKFTYPWKEILALWAGFLMLSSLSGLLASRKVFSAKPLELLREAS